MSESKRFIGKREKARIARKKKQRTTAGIFLAVCFGIGLMSVGLHAWNHNPAAVQTAAEQSGAAGDQQNYALVYTAADNTGNTADEAVDRVSAEELTAIVTSAPSEGTVQADRTGKTAVVISPEESDGENAEQSEDSDFAVNQTEETEETVTEETPVMTGVYLFADENTVSAGSAITFGVYANDCDGNEIDGNKEITMNVVGGTADGSTVTFYEAGECTITATVTMNGVTLTSNEVVIEVTENTPANVEQTAWENEEWKHLTTPADPIHPAEEAEE